LLNYSNGGHPELDTVILDGGSEYSVDIFYHLTSDEKDTQGIIWNLNEWAGLLPVGSLPIGRDGGNNQFVLKDTQEVYFALAVGNQVKMKKISDSFVDFIDSLQENSEYI